jgi:uncharacterized protein YrrD
MKMESKLIRGLPVIALNSGKFLGKVQELAVDAEQKKVMALIIGEKIFLRTRSQVIPYGRVHSFGSDAVTVANAEEVQDLPSRPDIEKMLEYRLINRDLISEEGNRVGVIADFTFDPTSGLIHGLVLKGGLAEQTGRELAYIPVETVLHFGKDFIISRRDAAARLEAYAGTSKNNMPLEDGPAKKQVEEIAGMARGLTRSLEVKAIDFALGREAGHPVADANGKIIIKKGEKVTPEIIDSARQKNLLYQVLFAAGVGELLEGIDITLEKVDAGSKRLMEAWRMFREQRREQKHRQVQESSEEEPKAEQAGNPNVVEQQLSELAKMMKSLQERLERLEKER